MTHFPYITLWIWRLFELLWGIDVQIALSFVSKLYFARWLTVFCSYFARNRHFIDDIDYYPSSKANFCMKISSGESFEIFYCPLYLHVCFGQCFFLSFKIRVFAGVWRLAKHFFADIENLIADVGAGFETGFLFGYLGYDCLAEVVSGAFVWVRAVGKEGIGESFGWWDWFQTQVHRCLHDSFILAFRQIIIITLPRGYPF